MPDFGRDFTEVLVAIGRIEEGIKSLRESVDRLEKKVDSQDSEIKDMQLDIQKLKTQRSTVKENIAMAISILAVTFAIVSRFLP